MRKEWIIEPLSLTKMAKYDKTGEQYRIISDSGSELRIIATNCGKDNNEIMVENLNQDKYGRKGSWYVSKTGKASYYANSDVYIWRGACDIEIGDLIKTYRSEDTSFYFLSFFDGWHIENRNNVGFLEYWCMDCYGGQLDLCRTKRDVDKEHRVWVELASVEDYDNYWKYALKAGYAYSEELHKVYEVPRVGDKYWSIEMDNGIPHIVEHDAPKSEEERPINHVMCSREYRRIESMLKKLMEHMYKREV